VDQRPHQAGRRLGMAPLHPQRAEPRRHQKGRPTMHLCVATPTITPTTRAATEPHTAVTPLRPLSGEYSAVSPILAHSPLTRSIASRTTAVATCSCRIDVTANCSRPECSRHGFSCLSVRRVIRNALGRPRPFAVTDGQDRLDGRPGSWMPLFLSRAGEQKLGLSGDEGIASALHGRSSYSPPLQ
jgi:hypothetical protein